MAHHKTDAAKRKKGRSDRERSLDKGFCNVDQQQQKVGDTDN